MYDDRLLRDFGLMPGAEEAPAGKVRSSLTRGNAAFQVVMSLLMVGGVAALGVWFAIAGIRGWGVEPDAPLLIAGCPAMLALAASWRITGPATSTSGSRSTATSSGRATSTPGA